MDRYSDTDNRKGREQLRLDLHPPRQISTLLRIEGSRVALARDVTPLNHSFESTTICAAKWQGTSRSSLPVICVVYEICGSKLLIQLRYDHLAYSTLPRVRRI